MVLDDRRQAFIANQTGTSMSDLFTLFTITGASHFMRNLVCMMLFGPRRRRFDSSRLVWTKLAVDFCCIIIPFYMVFLDFFSQALPVLVTVLAVCVGIITVCFQTWSDPATKAALHEWKERKDSMRKLDTSNLYSGYFGERLECIGYYRGIVLFITAFCILAVDFKAMPRRHAKTEEHGMSVLDCGLAAYTYANGIVDPVARFRGKLTWKQHSKWIKRELVDATALVTMGLVRVVLVAASGYQVHDTEYGPHWNFFFTLAVVKMFSRIVLMFLPLTLLLPAALVSIGSWEAILHYTNNLAVLPSSFPAPGVSGLIFNFLCVNKAGIFSCTGFFGIYLLSAWVGCLLFATRKSIFEWLEVAVLISVGMMSWMTTSSAISGLVSALLRDFALSDWIPACRGGFVAYAQAFFGPFLTSKLKEKPVISPEAEYHEPCLIDAFNRMSFVVFIAANIATGIINLSMETLDFTPVEGGALLSCYLLAMCVSLGYFYDKNFRKEEGDRRAALISKLQARSKTCVD